MDIAVVFNQMIQLFVVIGIGYILYKKGIFDDYTNKKLSSLLLSVASPSLVLSSVFQQDGLQEVNMVFLVFVVAIVVHIVLPILSYGLVKFLRVPVESVGVYLFMSVFSNVGFMGFPVIGAIFGNKAIFLAAMYNMGCNIFMYSLGVFLLHAGQHNKTKFSIHRLINPGFIASILACLIYFLNIDIPVIIVNTCASVGSITTPLAMLLIGSSLATISLLDVFRDKRIYLYSLIRQIIVPFVLFIVLKILVKEPYLLGVLFVLLSMPVASSAVLFASEYNMNSSLASKGVFVTTLISVVTIPLLVGILL